LPVEQRADLFQRNSEKPERHDLFKTLQVPVAVEPVASFGVAWLLQIVTELVNYKGRMLPFMPGQRTADKERAFFVIFSTMIGAVEIARILPDRVMREKVLAGTTDFLLRSF
jgi:hypothetical protein